MRITCPNCGFSRDMPEDRIPQAARLATCPKCQHKFRLREEEDSFILEGEGEQEEGPPSSSPAEEAGQDNGATPLDTQETREDNIWRRLEDLGDQPSPPGTGSGQRTQEEEPRWEAEGVPWERIQSLGFFPALFQTIKQVMLSPVKFYQDLPTWGGFGMPTAFYVLIMEVPALALIFWLMSGIFPQVEGEASGLFHLGFTGIGSLTFLLVFPVFMVVNLFVSSGLYHLFLILLQEGSAGYEGTFKVVCYSSAPMVLTLIPVFGMWVGGIWQLVCIYFGFKLVHDISPAKAVIPIVLVQLLFVLLLSGTTGLA
ncbi:MAG: zinc-ribbon domain-containing protein [Desulfohalobiaceae bacterium]|nr:zinc-ribbon domain-containing protein [Desulfohalobiaceae bacterium]